VLISVLFWNTKIACLYFPIGIEIEKRIKAEDWEYLNLDTNQMFIETFKFEEDFNLVVKHCFSTGDEIDEIIESMLNPSELATLDIEPNKWTLKIEDRMLQKKFNIYANKQYLSYTRSIMISGIIVFFFYTIFQAILSKKIESSFYLNMGFLLCYTILSLLTFESFIS